MITRGLGCKRPVITRGALCLAGPWPYKPPLSLVRDKGGNLRDKGILSLAPLVPGIQAELVHSFSVLLVRTSYTVVGSAFRGLT